MILMGYPDNGPSIKLSADATKFQDYIVKAARQTLVLDVMLEVIGLTADQVWAVFYTRGGFDPEFAEPDAVDNYLVVLGRIRGDRGHAARAGFLAGWATHRAAAQDVAS